MSSKDTQTSNEQYNNLEKKVRKLQAEKESLIKQNKMFESAIDKYIQDNNASTQNKNITLKKKETSNNNKQSKEQNYKLFEEITIKKINKFEKASTLRQQRYSQVQALDEKIVETEKILNETEKNLRELTVKHERIENAYNDIKSSKSVKMQLKYWSVKKTFGAFFSNIKTKIREFAEKSKFTATYLEKREINNVKKQKSKPNNAKSKSTSKLLNHLFENSDVDFINRIKEETDKVLTSNGGRYYDKFNYNIGIIADEFLYASYKDTSNFTFITPSNWKTAVPNTDFLIFVSTWRGLNDEWIGLGNVSEYTPKRNLAYKIIEEYKNNNKVTVFYSKEDPPNYDVFLGYAKKCDYIFTSCVEVVDNYKRDCQNENVNALSFGINPIYHNPISIRSTKKSDGVIFSGSWMTKYPERSSLMKKMFDEVIMYGKELKIIDRNYWRNDPKYVFPSEYHKMISPNIAHDTLQSVHKMYNWAININSVTQSKTMFANRCYELLASGNLLISNTSVGVNEKLPMVYTIENFSEISRIFDNLNDEQVYKRQIDAARSVMTNETTFERLSQVLNTVKLNGELPKRSVLVVANIINQQVKDMFNLQTYKNKTLISKEELNEQTYNSHDMITFFESTIDYDAFYLEDMVNAFKYTNSDYITKNAYYNGENFISGEEHTYVNAIKRKDLTLFWTKSFKLDYLLNIKENEKIENGYSIDRFNVNTKQIEVQKSQDFKLSVIIPVLNNGWHLLGKAFASLQRNSIFDEIEIILIDKGSNDELSDKIVKYLDKNNANVKAYFYESAIDDETAINKGEEISTSDFTMVLYPQDEAVDDLCTKAYTQAILM